MIRERGEKMYKKIRVVAEDSKEAKLYTHTAPHHADEVFATAMLSFIEDPIIVRTRNAQILENTDGIVYDVGGEYNVKKRRFDHHQPSFIKEREDGIKYSSAGLIWETYSAEILKTFGCEDIFLKEAYLLIDEEVIKGIDASDNGQSKACGELTVSMAMSALNTNWNDEKVDTEGAFIRACIIAREILAGIIKKTISRLQGRQMIEESIQTAEEHILILPTFIGGWIEAVLHSSLPEVSQLLYGIYQTMDGNWGIRAIPPSIYELMQQRKPFPQEWRGLSKEALAKASGIESAIFCHKAGFFAVTGTKEDAIKMAKKSSEY